MGERARVFSETTDYRVWTGALIRRSRVWLAYCPCSPRRYLTALPSWEGALDIALAHMHIYHGGVE